VAMPMLALTLYSFLPTWLSNRTTIARLGIGGGTGNMIRREDYEAAGGHEALRAAVVDDVGMARLLRRRGRKTIVSRADELVSVRMYESRRAIIDGFTKNMFAALDRSYAGTAAFLVFSVVFHLLPYAWAATGELFSILTVGLITLTRALLFLAIRYPFHYALWAHPFMILVWIWIAVRSMWVTGVRRRLAWRGRSYDAAGTRFGA
ncbi:MAG TPA: glycosyltransferase, partial [Thermoanaerobaculia bacterium]|nr:glycosyltransferase [Thermoanaerobaculia bacterium]